jgi:hypothetical protein
VQDAFSTQSLWLRNHDQASGQYNMCVVGEAHASANASAGEKDGEESVWKNSRTCLFHGYRNKSPLRDSEVLVRGNWRGCGPSRAPVGWLVRLCGVRGWLLCVGNNAYGDVVRLQ